MLWYGFIYYLSFLLFIAATTFYLLRLFYLFSFFKVDLTVSLFKYVLNFFIFFAFWSLYSIFLLFDFFSTFTWYSSSLGSSIDFLDYYFVDFGVSTTPLSLHLISIYYFPFVYIFVVVTTLSVLFCMTYNANELVSFMFYILIILVSYIILDFYITYIYKSGTSMKGIKDKVV